MGDWQEFRETPFKEHLSSMWYGRRFHVCWFKKLLFGIRYCYYDGHHLCLNLWLVNVEMEY